MSEIIKASEYLRLAREIEADASNSSPLRIAILSSFTASFLRPYIIVEAQRIGLFVDPWFAPYGQFEQQVLDPGSSMWQQELGFLWLAMRLEDVDPDLADQFPEIGPIEAGKRVIAVRERLETLAHAFRSCSRASILVSNLACPPLLDIFDANDPDGLTHIVAAENRELSRALAQIPDTHVFDWAGLRGELGSAFADSKLWYLARIPVAAKAQPAVARRLVRGMRALVQPAAKCIVLDLDQTLWGGVLGDDGPEGIQLGGGYPGNIFKDLQGVLGQLRRRGFLLALASKNDERLVLETLESHPEMVLRPSDFAAIFANWEPKPVNLRRIAKALNIGLDALIFLDDNPVERAAVRAELPMVQVVELPPEPLGYLEAVREIAQLDRPRVLASDRARASMYAQDAHRTGLQSNSASLEDYLRDLKMVASVGPCDPLTLERVHQLIQKTNQFNLTTRRYAMDELRLLAQSPDASVRWLRLRDRFGDLGLVCVAIVRRVEDGLWEIDTFLMSCRVMGRQIEDAFLSHLLDIAAASGALRVRAAYRPTAKNHMVCDFYPQHGFSEICRAEDRTIYELNIGRGLPAWPALIERSHGTEVLA